MRTDAPRLAILGAGPVGLEAGLLAASLGLPFAIYERGRPGENIRHWGHARMFSPFGLNSTALGRRTLTTDRPRQPLPAEGDLLTGREFVEAYLEPLAALPRLAENLQAGTAVVQVGRLGVLKDDAPGDPKRARQPFRLLLRAADGAERIAEAEVILDCTGTYGHPRWLGAGGIAAVGEMKARPHISWGLEDILGERRAHYIDRSILVVGAGLSAATAVTRLASLAAEHPSMWIVWLARGPGSQPLRRQVNDPLRERDQLAARANSYATRGEGHVEFHPGAAVEAIEYKDKVGFCVSARVGSAVRTWEVERVIGNVGYIPDLSLTRELQVELSPASEAPPGPRTTEPGYFLLGQKAAGRDPGFLLKAGLEQLDGVFASLTGRAVVPAGRGRG